MKRIWIVFGRFNPPTIGHKKMIDQLQKLSGNDDYMVGLHGQMIKRRILYSIQIRLTG